MWFSLPTVTEAHIKHAPLDVQVVALALGTVGSKTGECN